MKTLIQALTTAFALAVSVNAAAQTDNLFASGYEPGLQIHGIAYGPSPLPGARIEARFADMRLQGVADSDGRFRLAIEHRQLDGNPLIELRARGTGNHQHIEWLGQLGPAAQLAEAAGDDQILTVDENVAVNLTPRSTAVSAYMHAANGFQPLSDTAVFERSARSQQLLYITELTIALALVAQGDLALPDGAATTWESVGTLEASQRLLAAYRRDHIWFCDAPYPHCALLAALPVDPIIFPPAAPDASTRYTVGAGGFEYSAGWLVRAFSIDGPEGTYHANGPNRAGEQPIVVQMLDNDIYQLSRPDNGPLARFESYVLGGSSQIYQLMDRVSERVRIAHDVAGLRSVAVASTYRIHYPNNPDVPERMVVEPFTFPLSINSHHLPATQAIDLPQLTNRRWVMTTPFESGSASDTDSILPHDIHAFHTTGGVTERGQQTFSLVSVGTDRFTLDYSGQTVEVRLISQDVPGLWRTELTIDTGTSLLIGNGVLVEVEAGTPSWTAAIAPGAYRVRSPGDDCDGPYADIEALNDSGGACLSAARGWRKAVIRADGTGDWSWAWPATPGMVDAFPIRWSLTPGNSPRRLIIEHVNSQNVVTHTQGWEIIKQVGNRYWVLRNFNEPFSTLPPNFIPTRSLIAIDRQ